MKGRIESDKPQMEGDQPKTTTKIIKNLSVGTATQNVMAELTQKLHGKKEAKQEQKQPLSSSQSNQTYSIDISETTKADLKVLEKRTEQLREAVDVYLTNPKYAKSEKAHNFKRALYDQQLFLTGLKKQIDFAENNPVTTEEKAREGAKNITDSLELYTNNLNNLVADEYSRSSQAEWKKVLDPHQAGGKIALKIFDEIYDEIYAANTARLGRNG